ncbi:MAG: N-acetylmuramoyl-L-alanine amidase [Pseudomonadota bacterium]|nr:N-acetylmuramoyl-L-alanine amidase [Pseudomonadota bacterium]
MKIRNHRLVQDDGTAIPYLASPNKGGVMQPRWLVMHYTAGRSAESSISWLVNPQAKASAHLVIGRDGKITQLVPFNVVAWHAGASIWQGVSGLNHLTTGIELDNVGRLDHIAGKWISPLKIVVPDDQVRVARHKNDAPGLPPSGWQTYTPEQIDAAFSVSQALIAHYGLQDIIGHDDIAPGRKSDPGPDFPLASLRARLFGRQEDDLPIFTSSAALNVRSGPGTEHPILAGSPIPAGTRVQALEQNGLWWKVDVLDEVSGVMDLVGWCHGRYLQAA